MSNTDIEDRHIDDLRIYERLIRPTRGAGLTPFRCTAALEVAWLRLAADTRQTVTTAELDNPDWETILCVWRIASRLAAGGRHAMPEALIETGGLP